MSFTLKHQVLINYPTWPSLLPCSLTMPCIRWASSSAHCALCSTWGQDCRSLGQGKRRRARKERACEQAEDALPIGRRKGATRASFDAPVPRPSARRTSFRPLPKAGRRGKHRQNPSKSLRTYSDRFRHKYSGAFGHLTHAAMHMLILRHFALRLKKVNGNGLQRPEFPPNSQRWQGQRLIHHMRMVFDHQRYDGGCRKAKCLSLWAIKLN